MKLKKWMLLSTMVVYASLNALAAPASAKENLRDTLPANDTTLVIFEKVEIEASYPGGEKAWIRFIQQTVDPGVPAKRKAPLGLYTVIVQFVVDKDGNISDIKPLTNHGYGMEAEVVRVLKNASRWKPAIQDGRKVRAYRKQPVTFQVAEEEKKKKRNKDE